jgi:serine/threonine-protein kinase
VTPSRIGRYQIVGPLAAGGMAEILLARLSGPSGFERIVVVKRILPHLAREPAFVSMFLDEARIVSGIRHPNVVQVQELGHEDGELFLVMEYLEGESASSLLKRSVARNEPLPPVLGAYIVAEACAGLHAAHELTDVDGKPQNIVHRDVSPQNLLVTYAGEVKVLDFGIAKAADRITRTEAGQLKGKFEYMSPEQCRGQDLDRRADVFSLGVVLYELTTGRRLFKRRTQLETLKAITEEPVVPPARVRADYPAALELVVMKALSRRRDDRHASASELRREIVAAIASARPAEDARDWLGRVMAGLFEDRILEKREMVRRVQRGGEIAHVPAGEVSEPVDVPTAELVAEGTAAPSLLETPNGARRAPEGRSRVTLVAGAALVLAVLGVGSFAALRLQGPTQAAPGPSPLPGASVATDPALLATSVPSAPAATQTLLHVETRPPGATVTIGSATRGVTPVDLTLPRSVEPVSLELRKSGYQPLTQSLVPDVDQRIVVSLDPMTGPRAGRPTTPSAPSRPPPAVPAATAPPSASPFQRFD